MQEHTPTHSSAEMESGTERESRQQTVGTELKPFRATKKCTTSIIYCRGKEINASKTNRRRKRSKKTTTRNYIHESMD